jgi:alpha-D-glucose phosphate-specific phosphoglucomutase
MLKFGTDGWRAGIAAEFTFENLAVVTTALADYLLAKNAAPKVIIGYDNRFMGADFAAAAAGTLSSKGIKAVIGDVSYPTPTIALAVLEHRADGAIMLTASHNPYYYNGFKFIPEYAGPATGEITAAIEKNIADILTAGITDRINLPADPAMIEKRDFAAGYSKAILDFIDCERIKSAGLKAGLDPYYGSGIRLLPALAEASGLRCAVIHERADCLFGGTLPDPNEKNLGDLRKLVLSGGLDIGLALDGDADRFGIIADDGTYLTPNQVLALVILHMVENRGASGVAVRTVATTGLIDAIGKKKGLEVIETPVGFKYIGAMMRERAVIAGGEESGGLSVLGHIPEKDGILACLLVAEMVAVEGKGLSEIWKRVTEEYGRFYNTRLDIEYPADKKDMLLSGLRDDPPAEIGGQKVVSVNPVDGAKIYLENGAWLLVRPSGTEPLVRAYIEASSRLELDVLSAAAGEMLKA